MFASASYRREHGVHGGACPAGCSWPPRLVGARLNASNAARRATEIALPCASGSSFDNGSELSRLFRDATAGLFHPPSADTARPIHASALLKEPTVA